MGKKEGAAVAIFLFMAVVVVIMVSKAAYAQEVVTLNESDESANMVISETVDKILKAYSDNPDVLGYLALSDSGRLTISFDNDTLDTVEDDTAIITTHPYVPENGYELRGGYQIIQPNGTELFP
jgi:hypothetical protein